MGIGSNIRKIRTTLRLSQESFAEAINSSQSSVSAYEIETKTPSLKVAQNIVKLAKAKKIKVTLNDFFPDE